VAQVIWTQKIEFLQSEILTDKDAKSAQIVHFLPANEGQIRPLLTGWKYQLTQSKKEILLEVGKEKQKETLKKGDSPVLSTIDTTGHSTRDTIANDLGWSTGKVAMAKMATLA